MKVDFTVPEQRASEIKLGQEVRVGVTEGNCPSRARSSARTRASIRRPGSSRFRGHRRSNKDGAILPGQFLHVEAVLPEQPNVITVPQTAVIASLYGDYVYTIDEEQRDGERRQVAKQVFVKTGRRGGGVSRSSPA